MKCTVFFLQIIIWIINVFIHDSNIKISISNKASTTKEERALWRNKHKITENPLVTFPNTQIVCFILSLYVCLRYIWTHLN
jgi:hypothetical protein